MRLTLLDKLKDKKGLNRIREKIWFGLGLKWDLSNSLIATVIFVFYFYLTEF